MKGPAASHPAPTATSLPRPRGGTLRSAAQSLAFAALLVSGLDLWMVGPQPLVLWAHLLIGLGLLVFLVPWLIRHVPKALRQSQRRAFTNLSWALLACWTTLLASGLAMAVPALLWLGGFIWFPERPVTQALSLIHFWSSWLAAVGLVLHLTMRHWVRGPKWG